MFLHGYWRDPKSVILDWRSYQEITLDEEYRSDLLSAWKMITWIYVGCGANGLNDPDFGLLLNRYGKRARQADLWDFCLVRDDQREEFQAQFNQQEINVLAVPFGKSYDDLPEYLHGLSSAVNVLTPHSSLGSVDSREDNIPTPPAFYARPDYIGSHRFVGRKRELEELCDWANPADPANVLLYEAIGGNGKSMLTWEWTTKYAMNVRDDWAGCFWYSFYERDAIMADFCQHALAYMTGTPLKELQKKKTAELKGDLLTQLHAKPWLLILDGLERVLVAYHRIDAAEMEDDLAINLNDKIAKRHPRSAIREEDNDLLRCLAAAKPSKILISSRLVPRSLLNKADQAIPGVRPIMLQGLRPPDAELLLRSCAISGESNSIQHYLTENCDNHPLVIGSLGGLIRNYLPERGNFDIWATDPEGGAALNLAELDLIQRRNHILESAFDSLPPMSRQLLATLAFISESVDYETLKAFNPHLPPEPEEVEKPEPPEENWDWEYMTDKEKAELQKEYNEELTKWNEYEEINRNRWDSIEYRDAASKLAKIVKDLEERGLLQYDEYTKRYDLHPVVRGVAVGGMKPEERENYGKLVVDHFSSLPHNPYEEAVKLDDLQPGLNIVRALIKLGKFQEAADQFVGILCNPLLYKLNAYSELLSIERPFFNQGWDKLPDCIDEDYAIHLAKDAGIALMETGQNKEAFNAVIIHHVEEENWEELPTILSGSFCKILLGQNRLAKISQIMLLSKELATAIQSEEELISAKSNYFSLLCIFGRYEEAESIWNELHKYLYIKMNQRWAVTFECSYVGMQLIRSQLKEDYLTKIEVLAREGNYREIIQNLHRIRGDWYMQQNQWSLAVKSFSEALRMARETGQPTAVYETHLVLARFQSGDQFDARADAERLASVDDPADLLLAKLWLALNDETKAKHHAIAAYKWAWADGELYVQRYSLNEASDLLKQMDVPIPALPSYDPAKDISFPWEVDIQTAIENHI